MEVQSKINDVLKILNNGQIRGDWIATGGNNALTIVELSGSSVNFRPDAGIPLKVFVNTKTGEIKTYDARAFLAEQKNA